MLELITALANFEKLIPPDAAGRQRLIEDGFGERPRFESWLGFWNGVQKPIGYAVLFDAYSTFRANPTLYLEDLFVLPEYRKRASVWHSCGNAFRWPTTGLRAHGMDVPGLEHKSSSVYERLGARRLSEWYLYRLTREDMEKLLVTDTGTPAGL